MLKVKWMATFDKETSASQLRVTSDGGTRRVDSKVPLIVCAVGLHRFCAQTYKDLANGRESFRPSRSATEKPGDRNLRMHRNISCYFQRLSFRTREVEGWKAAKYRLGIA